jgi:outer membrane lipoprotein-sorting protein
MRPSDKIERLIQKTNYAADPAKRKQILNDASQALQQSRQETPSANPAFWSNRMNKTILKTAVAAIILIAAGIIMYHKTGSFDGATVAWADVLKQIQDFRPYQCKYTVYHTGKSPFGMITTYLSLSQRREERENGQTFIVDMRQCPVRTLLLDGKRKIAGLTIDYNMGPCKDPDWLRVLAGMKDGNMEELGVQEIKGIKTKGFRKVDQYNNITIWADTKTELPVKLEITHSQEDRKIIIEDFVFDVTFDEKLFSTQALEGYQVYETTKDKTADKDKTYEIQSADGPKEFIPCSFVETIYREGKQISRSRLYELNLTQLRVEDESGNIIIQDRSVCPMKTLRLYPESKKAELSIDYRFGSSKSQDFLEMLTAMKKYDSEKLGVQDIDGIQAEGFRRRDPFNDIAIWADLKTGLPVKIEIVHTKPDQKIVDSNFDFNIKLDPSLFSTQAPAGYEINETTVGQEKMKAPNQKLN